MPVTVWNRVFCTKALIGDTIFTSPIGDGTAILRCNPSHAKGLAACSAKGVPSFLSYLKTLSNGRAPGIEPATCRSAVKQSADWANPAAAKKMNNSLLTNIACKYHAH